MLSSLENTCQKNVNGHDPGRNVQLDNSSRIYGHKEMFTDAINSNVAYVIEALSI